MEDWSEVALRMVERWLVVVLGLLSAVAADTLDSQPGYPVSSGRYTVR